MGSGTTPFETLPQPSKKVLCLQIPKILQPLAKRKKILEKQHTLINKLVLLLLPLYSKKREVFYEHHKVYSLFFFLLIASVSGAHAGKGDIEDGKGATDEGGTVLLDFSEKDPEPQPRGWCQRLCATERRVLCGAWDWCTRTPGRKIATGCILGCGALCGAAAGLAYYLYGGDDATMGMGF